jgi:hypothetical protein
MPNARLEMPAEVKRYNILLLHQLCSYFGDKALPQHVAKRLHWILPGEPKTS